MHLIPAHELSGQSAAYQRSRGMVEGLAIGLSVLLDPSGPKRWLDVYQRYGCIYSTMQHVCHNHHVYVTVQIIQDVERSLARQIQNGTIYPVGPGVIVDIRRSPAACTVVVCFCVLMTCS